MFGPDKFAAESGGSPCCLFQYSSGSGGISFLRLNGKSSIKTDHIPDHVGKLIRIGSVCCKNLACHAVRIKHKSKKNVL